MNRRDWLQSGALSATAGAGALLAAVGTSQAQTNKKAPAKSSAAHEHDHHHSMYTALMRTAAECTIASEACLAHCLILLGQGQAEMADCAVSVNELMAVCTALHKLSAQNSTHVPRFAALVARMCDDCEKQCRKHADHHPECKECAEACAKCSKECKKVAKA